MGHRILVVGDHIYDDYIQGTIDEANEGGPRFRANEYLARTEQGGAAFVRDAVASFSHVNHSNVDYIRTSISRIKRFQNQETKETLLTVDDFEDHYFETDKCRGYTHDAAIVWDDSRCEDSYPWGDALTTLHPEALTVVDSVRAKSWDTPFTCYIKMTLSDWDGYRPKHATLILTSSRAVSLYEPRKPLRVYNVNEIDPIDPIGAGDVFLSVFVTILLEGWGEDKAIREAIHYASKSVTYHGCRIPRRDRARTFSTV